MFGFSSLTANKYDSMSVQGERRYAKYSPLLQGVWGLIV